MHDRLEKNMELPTQLRFYGRKQKTMAKKEFKAESKRLLDLMKDDPNFDLTMYRSADGVIDYESALNQFRQNAVEQTIRLIPELETEILSMGNAIETAIQKAIRLGENYHEILNVLARVQSGESLTATFKDVANKHKKQYKIIKNWIP